MMMIQSIGSWLHQLWQYWFESLPANAAPAEIVPLSDEGYEALFQKLLIGIEQKWTQADLLNTLNGHQDDPWFVLWLRRYSRACQRSRFEAEAMLRALTQIGTMNWGNLSGVARELGQRELPDPRSTSPQAVTLLKIESVAARLPLPQYPKDRTIEESLAEVAPAPNADASSSLFERAAQRYQAGELSGAITLWEEAIAVNPYFPEAYNGRGSALYYLGRYDEAIADFSAAIRLQPDFHLAYNNRGNVYADLGQLQAALADYTQAIECVGNFYFAYNGRAAVLARLGHCLWAIADYNQALEIYPEFHFAYNGRGMARADLGQYQDAIADFSRALECNPQNPDAYHNRGNAYAEIEQDEQAIADYTQALILNPNLHQTYCSRGKIYVKHEQYQAAIADYSEALNIHPHFILAYNSRGIAYHCIGEYNAAIADFRRTLELAPTFWQAWINWGCTLIEAYDEAIALQTWQKGLKELPDTAPDYLEACARLYHYQGKALSRQAQHQENSYLYFDALDCYQKAARAVQDNPQWRSLYLEILQDLQIAYRFLGDTAQAQKWRSLALDLLEKLLLDTKSPAQKRQLESKFAALYPLKTEDWTHSIRFQSELPLAERFILSPLTPRPEEALSSSSVFNSARS
jgi:tetratricopeptide (TPR) repeat protein